MSIIKMRGPIDVLFAFKIFSLPVPTRPGTRTFWQVPDPSRPEVKNPYPSDPERDQGENLLKKQSLKMGDWIKYRIGYFCQIRGYYEVSSWCNFHNMQNNVMAPQL